MENEKSKQAAAPSPLARRIASRLPVPTPGWRRIECSGCGEPIDGRRSVSGYCRKCRKKIKLAKAKKGLKERKSKVTPKEPAK